MMNCDCPICLSPADYPKAVRDTRVYHAWWAKSEGDPIKREELTRRFLGKRTTVLANSTRMVAPAANPVADRAALYGRFGSRQRIATAKGCGVITASDAGAYVGLQLMLASLLLSHSVPITVFDLGLTPEQVEWLQRQGVSVVKPSRLAMNRDVDYWAAWNKPIYLSESPYARTLWLDADVIVADSLVPLFEAIDSGPLVVRDYFAAVGALANKTPLYSDFPTPTRITDLCSGVIGFEGKRDAEWLGLAVSMLERAAKDSFVRECISWWDQGIFIYACEKMGIEPVDRRAWNAPGRYLTDHEWRASGIVELLERLPSATITHYQGRQKPWRGWGPLDIELSSPSNLRVYLLGHDAEGLARTPHRPFIEPVDLNSLNPDNSLGESRVFDWLSSASIELPEYVGFASWKWNDKYKGVNALPVEELHRLELRPDVVWCAARTDNYTWHDAVDWPDHFERFNPGIKKYIDEIREKSGLKETGPGLWANNFVCHRDVFRDFLKHQQKMMLVFEDRHLAFTAADPSRAAAYVAEAIAVNYWASRSDLKILEARWGGEVPDVEGAVSAKPKPKKVQMTLAEAKAKGLVKGGCGCGK